MGDTIKKIGIRKDAGQYTYTEIGVDANNVDIDSTTLDQKISTIEEDITKKVDKVEGKGLSSNDFTDEHLSIVETMSTGNITTGVKGDAETEYRIGNVNLTAENIGALPVDGTAKKATADANGNVIPDTYATKDELTDSNNTLAFDIVLNRQTLGYGKKNLLKTVARTSTSSGVTITVNDDGSVIANGTATADVWHTLNDDFVFEANKKYIASGASGGSEKTYFISTGAMGYQIYNDEKMQPIRSTDTVKSIQIVIKKGYTAENLTFYPMIRSADIADGTYEPYVDDVDTRIESLNTALNKAVSSSLNGKNFSTLEEFVEATNPNDVSHGHMFRFKDIGRWGPLRGTSDWYACIVQYQNRYVAGSTASVDGKIDLLYSKNQHWTGYVTGNKDSGLAATWNRVAGASDTLNTLEEISANTKEEMIAGALALKELYEQSGGVQLGYTSDGKPGYYKAGADTVTPFSASGASITGISNVENSLSRMIYTYVTFDTSSHNSLTISGVNNVDSDSLGNSVFLTVAGKTSSTSATLAEYTGTFSATLDVTNYDSVSLRIPAINSSLVSSEDGTIAKITSLKFE